MTQPDLGTPVPDGAVQNLPRRWLAALGEPVGESVPACPISLDLSRGRFGGPNHERPVKSDRYLPPRLQHHVEGPFGCAPHLREAGAF